MSYRQFKDLCSSDQRLQVDREYVNLVEKKFNKRFKKLNCDNGKEYLNKEI